MDFIEKLGADFRTTLTSTAVQLGLNTKEECFLISSSHRQRQWFICSQNRSFQLLSDSLIHGHSCAAEVNAGKLKSRDTVDAGFWLDDFKYNHKVQITEDSRYSPQLDKTLTLLWLHEVI